MSDHNANIKLLIKGCIDKNSASERKLFELFYGYISSICRLYSHSEEDKDEMLNDTFYKTFRYIDRYDDNYEFKPWIRKICINSCLQHLNKFKNQFHFEQLDNKIAEEFQEHTLESITDSQYLGLIQKLSPAYRTVFNLYVFEEYKHHEIADLLDISVGTSKSNLSRAKLKLNHLILELKNSSIINDKAHG